MSLSNTTIYAYAATAPDPNELIADFGHPHFPGWMLIMILVLITIAAQSMSPSNTIIRTRPTRTSITRLVRRAEDGGM